MDLFLLRVASLHDDADLARYVATVGHRIASTVEAPGVDWTFRVLDLTEPAAWAAPGGYVYVTHGLLAHLGSEAELAGLLAHEIAHVAAGHASAVREGLPVSVPTDPGELWALFEHDQDMEREADQLAVEYLERAGYDPRAMLALFDSLRRASSAFHDQTRAEEEGDRDHPPLEARAALVARCIAGRPAGQVSRER